MYVSQSFFTHGNNEKVFAIMEERSQTSNSERSYGKRSYDYLNDNHGNVIERIFNPGEHRRCGHNLTKDTLNGETKETLKQDRISAMPDLILLHILSFLPTKDAKKASMLSQRWLSVWNFVPNLHFTCSNWSRKSTNNFVTFIDQTLLFHRGCRINKFLVSYHYVQFHESHFDKWVHFVSSANVEELCLVLSSGDGRGYCHYVLPQYLYTNSLMTTLKLICCDVVPNGLISWKSLKSLLIGYANLSEDVIQKILVGAPLLESLDLGGCCCFNQLDIGSASLRKLVVRDYRDSTRSEHDSSLEISAPNLQSLDILGCMILRRLRLTNIQSLVDCNLNFWLGIYIQCGVEDYEVHRNVLRELLDGLGHVKKLTMGNWGIQVLSTLEFKDMISPLSECKCLIVDMYILKGGILGVASLLQCSLNLETLVINMTSLYESEYKFDENSSENYWTLELGCSKRSFLHLKVVKIVGFVAQCCEFRLVILLTQFLLQKGKKLEKIVINAQTGSNMGCSQKELLQMTQKLQSLARISPQVVVMFSP